MTTLDEAIKQCEETAEKNEIRASWFRDKEGYENCIEYANEYRQLAEWLKELKSLRQKRPKGHWIYLKHDKARCSECEDIVFIAQMYGNANYCPNCGADMRGNKAESEES